MIYLSSSKYSRTRMTFELNIHIVDSDEMKRRY